MSFTEDLHIAAEASQEELSRFLVEVCDLNQSARFAADGTEIDAYVHGEIQCWFEQSSTLKRELVEEAFGFKPAWSFYLLHPKFPENDPMPEIVQVMQLIMLEYEADWVWQFNGESPHMVRKDGKLLVQGHSKYSRWAAYLREIAEQIGLPYEVVVMTVAP